MSQWHGGKGSAPRPRSVPKDVWEDNWERVFGKKEPEIKVRKSSPPQGKTKVHKDRTKYDRNKSKQELLKDVNQ